MRNSTLRTGQLPKSVALLILLAFAPTACTSKKKDEPANTVRLASVAKIKGFDPIFADDLYGGTETMRVYEGLLQYHYLKRPYTLVPALSEALPERSKDNKTFTFKLKKGVLFQDDPCFKESGGKGRELTAEDFIYSFKRLADAKNASPGWWVFEGKIEGLDEWREAGSKAGSADYAAVVSGLTAPDRYTLKIKLKAPSIQFLYFLAMPFTAVVPREAVEHYGKEFLNHPVGTGAFRLVENLPGSKMVYAKNPTFRKDLYPSEGAPGDKELGLLADAGKPVPMADRIVVQVFEESQPLWLNLISGKLDLAAIPKDNYSSAVTPGKELNPDLKAKGMRLVKEAELDLTFTSFNMDDPLVGKNKLLRQAMSLAYDEDQYIELFYNGRAVAAQGPVPPGIFGYDAAFKNPFRQFNVAKAKELIARAGYPEGKGLPVIEYATLSDSTNRQSAEYLQKMLGAIGVKLKVNTYSWPEFQATVKNRKAQMYSFAWGADYPDAENFLQLYLGRNESPGPNNSNYKNPEYDKLYEKLLTMTDGPARNDLIKKMVAILVEDCPSIFGAHRIAFALVHPWLKNYKRHEFNHGMSKYLKVDTTLARP